MQKTLTVGKRKTEQLIGWVVNGGKFPVQRT